MRSFQFFESDENFDQIFLLKHQTSIAFPAIRYGPNKTIIPSIERKFNSLSNHGSLKALSVKAKN